MKQIKKSEKKRKRIKRNRKGRGDRFGPASKSASAHLRTKPERVSSPSLSR
jgi:hypothetical protein